MDLSLPMGETVGQLIALVARQGSARPD